MKVLLQSLEHSHSGLENVNLCEYLNKAYTWYKPAPSITNDVNKRSNFRYFNANT